MGRPALLLALLCGAHNVDLTYPFIEIPFVFTSEEAGGEQLIERNFNNTSAESAEVVHECAGGRIKLTVRHVGDGICDCCDGSDETGCPNTCAQWEKAIVKRNDLIVSTMQQLSALRSERLERGLELRDAKEPEPEPEGEREDGPETEQPETVEQDEGKRKSLTDYAKWMLSAKERGAPRTSWFSSIWSKLKSKSSAFKKADVFVPQKLRESQLLKDHPEWLYTASLTTSTTSMVIGEKTYSIDRLLSISMRENWQHHQPKFGELTRVEVADLTEGKRLAVQPTRFGELLSPTIFHYENGSECRDKFFSDADNAWVTVKDRQYSAQLFTMCGPQDQLRWVEFQKPCELLAVLESPAACVAPRTAIVENLPSGRGKRVEL